MYMHEANKLSDTTVPHPLMLSFYNNITIIGVIWSGLDFGLRHNFCIHKLKTHLQLQFSIPFEYSPENTSILSIYLQRKCVNGLSLFLPTVNCKCNSFWVQKILSKDKVFEKEILQKTFKI